MMIRSRLAASAVVVLVALGGGCAHRSTETEEALPSGEAALTEAQRLELQAAGLRQEAASKETLAGDLRAQAASSDYSTSSELRSRADRLSSEARQLRDRADEMERRARQLRRKARAPDGG